MTKISIISSMHNINDDFYKSLSETTHFDFDLILLNTGQKETSNDYYDKIADIKNFPTGTPLKDAYMDCISLINNQYVAFINNTITLTKNWDQKLISYMDDYSLDVISPDIEENKIKHNKNFLYPGISTSAYIVRTDFLKSLNFEKDSDPKFHQDIFSKSIDNQLKNQTIGPHIASDVLIKNTGKSRNDLILKKPKASLIVAAYKNTDFLEKVLLSVLNQTEQDFEVVIADDGSGPEIKNLIDKFKDKVKFPIQHAWHEDNGFRKTVIANKAVMLARSEYLIFIDGDCILHPRFISSHIKHKKKTRILAGRRIMLNEDTTNELTNDDIISKKYTSFKFWWGWGHNQSLSRGLMLPFAYFVDNLFRKHYDILGCNFSLHKGDYIRINGYNEDILGRGTEDSNIDSRLKLAGCAYKKVSHVALQYHLHHNFDPIPHSDDNLMKFHYPENYWCEKGIIKETTQE
ncbi:MAG: glycosyltransferase [Desulfobacterales bacterium]|nr:glycosyltransferase [Desulfobacterales bacterium]